MRSHAIELKEANAYVAQLHRHHRPVQGHRFSVGVIHKGTLRGVAIVGRPVARALDRRTIVEVLRCCTDGTRNACSFLYGATARIARDLGYARIQTYILEEEEGTSLRAAGWERGYTTKGGSWNSRSRSGRREDQPQGPKVLYFKQLIEPWE